MKYIKTSKRLHLFPDFIQHLEHYENHMGDEIVRSAGFAYFDEELRVVGYGKSISLNVDSDTLGVKSCLLQAHETHGSCFDYTYLSEESGGYPITFTGNEGRVMVTCPSLFSVTQVARMINGEGL